jgi:hypothetical protein
MLHVWFTRDLRDPRARELGLTRPFPAVLVCHL